MDEHRMAALVKKYGTDRIIVNSAADWGISDPLKVSKTAQAMREAGFGEDDVERLVWRNPIEFFAQSGRLELEDEAEPDRTATFAGSSVLRGERPDS
jgi:hypothetical protein